MEDPNSISHFLRSSAILTVAFIISFLLSTFIIRFCILKRLTPGDSSAKGSKAVGFWIGFCETLLIFLFVTAGQYGALAIIMGAKEFVRKEKIQEDASYYLLGTLVNLTLAILAARVAMWFI